ncbi:MAG: hypothetical protein ACR2QA_16525 [Solirubrobacteraceae bacterium]
MRSGLRTLAFGDLDLGSWGASWSLTRARPPVQMTVGAGLLASPAHVTMEGCGENEDWSVTGEDVELVVASESQAAALSADGEATGFEQLCRVTGRFAHHGAEHAVDCPGRRGLRTEVDLDALESVRDVSAWFGSGDGLAVVSLRPRGVGGHERDLITAAWFQSNHPQPISDPRLSTTYNDAGRPSRVSFEAWLGEPDGEEYPRRAAGEAIGRGDHTVQTGFELHATAFRWHGGAPGGAGVYLLARSI